MLHHSGSSSLKRQRSSWGPGCQQSSLPLLALLSQGLPSSPLAEGGGAAPTASTLWPCAVGRQDKLQTETQKDFWTVAQWADSVRRWLGSPSRPPASAPPAPPHPCSSPQLPGPGQPGP